MNRLMSPVKHPPELEMPAVVQTLRFIKDPFSLLCEAWRKHGDIFEVNVLGIGRWVFLCSPALVREMFKAPPDVLSAGEVNRSQLGFLLGLDSAFVLDGTAHRERHRIVFPLLSGQRALQHIPSMRRIALRALERLPVGRPFSFLHHAHRISLEIQVEGMCGDSDPARVQRLTDLVDDFAARGVRSSLMVLPSLQKDLGRWSPWGRVMGRKRAVVAALAEELDRRLADGDDSDDGEDSGDIFRALARAEQQDGERLSRQSLFDEAVTLLITGHETTGNILAWTMETLHSHPEALMRVREELDTVLGGGPVEAEHLPQLEYLHAAIHETVRYRPLAPMAGLRLAKEPFEIGGFVVPEGRFVAQCLPAMAIRPDLFSRPEVFDPEHFYQRKTKAFDWNPFGGGTRMCIGRVLAEVVLEVVIATLLQRADFRIAQKSVTPVRKGIFFSPNKGLRMEREEREPSPAGGSRPPASRCPAAADRHPGDPADGKAGATR